MQEPGTHKLTEALKGQTTDPTSPAPPGPKGPGSTHDEVAEQTRRQQEARPEAVPDRDEKLTEIGRGHQTHG